MRCIYKVINILSCFLYLIIVVLYKYSSPIIIISSYFSVLFMWRCLVSWDEVCVSIFYLRHIKSLLVGHFKINFSINYILCNLFCFVRFSDDSNVVDAACKGAMLACHIVPAIAANLIACVALVAFLNSIISWCGLLAGIEHLSFEVRWWKSSITTTKQKEIKLFYSNCIKICLNNYETFWFETTNYTLQIIHLPITSRFK